MDMQLILYLTTLFLFLFHELEEICCFNKWFERNHAYLIKRFPRLGKRMINQFNHLSTKGFAIIALEETIILILLLLYTLFAIRLEIWIGIIIMLTFHWLQTIIQSIVLGRLIPGTITALAGICFGIYMIWFSAGWYPVAIYVKWGIILFIFAMLNLWFMHIIVIKIRKQINKNK